MHRYNMRGATRSRENVLARSRDVKERIGPIVHRLKASLETIQRLEDSFHESELKEMARKSEMKMNMTITTVSTNMNSLGTIQEEEDAEEDRSVSNNCTDKNVGSNNNDNGGRDPGIFGTQSNKDDGANDRKPTTSQPFVPGRSRKLMQGSMEMVRRKLLKLKSLEEMLVESEDRGEFLKHQMIQIEASAMIATSHRKADSDTVADDSNESLLRRIDVLQEEIRVLETKCETIDDVTRERDRLLVDLAERQSKIRTLADQCDDLQCQVEQLTITSDELLNALKNQEDRTAFLEEELVESRKYDPIPFVRSSTGSSSYCDGESPRTVLSDIASPVSLYLLCEGDNHNEQGKCCDDVHCYSLPSISDSDNGNSNNVIDGPLPVSYRPMDQQLPTAHDSKSLEDNLIQRLMEKIEALDRENAELRQSKERIAGKYQALNEQVKKHASVMQ